jgi:hypothetical protein
MNESHHRIRVSRGDTSLEVEGPREFVETTYARLCGELLAFAVSNHGSGVGEPRADLKALRTAIKSGAVVEPSEADSPPNRTAPRLGRGLARLGLSIDDVRLLAEEETGELIPTNLGNGRAETEQRIAAIIAVQHLSTENRLWVPRSELKTACESFNVFSINHFAEYMSRAKVGANRVFVQVPGGWTVTKPGEAYVTASVRELVEATRRTSSGVDSGRAGK